MHDVATELADQPQAQRLTALLFVTFHGAELDPRPACGLLWRESLPHPVLGSLLQMELHLVRQVAFNAPAPDHTAEPTSEGESTSLHTSPARVPRAAAMAAASRFQLLAFGPQLPPAGFGQPVGLARRLLSDTPHSLSSKAPVLEAKQPGIQRPVVRFDRD